MTPCTEEPSVVVGALLSDRIGPQVEGLLGHGVEPGWHGCDGNRAIEVLGNLLGGSDTRKLSMTMDPAVLSDANDADFYIDDTSIIVCDIFQTTTL